MRMSERTVTLEVNPRFEPYMFDWDYMTYLLVGAYGSGKSFTTAEKFIVALMEKKRKLLVVREVYDTIRESCFALLVEILAGMDYVAETQKEKRFKAWVTSSPMKIVFPNGSQIIFRGCDKPNKFKSIHDVWGVWLEEGAEIKYSAFKELRGRLRPPGGDPVFIITTNPVAMETWVYRHFFERTDDDGNKVLILDHEKLYAQRTLVHNGVYYHHSLPEDNLFLQASYIKTLDEMKEYDPDLYRVARWGRFGPVGRRVLPQFSVADSHEEVLKAIKAIPQELHFHGMDLGFEESYNAVVDMAVEDKTKTLYLYGQYYKNHTTDDVTADELLALGYGNVLLVMENAEPKTIAYYRKRGLKVRGTKKLTRIAQVRKVKRFKRIVCSPECRDIIAELQTLTYKQTPQGETVYDEFNIDPHTFSAIWYGLDRYDVADVKEQKTNSRTSA